MTSIMKRIFSAVLLLSMVAGCKPKPVVFDGTILGYDGQEVDVTLTKDYSREQLEIAEDGSFHIEKMLDEAITGGISIIKGGSYYGLIVPGKTYHFSVDLSKTPAAWEYESDCPVEDAFYKYMRDTLLKIDYKNYVFPDKFADFDAMWTERLAEGAPKLAAVKDRHAVKYFKQTIAQSIAHNKIIFANQLENKGLRPEDDPDYMKFFNSVDLSDEKMRTLLGSMIQIKSGMYCDTIPASIRYIQAIEELAPSQYVRDSVTAKHVDSVIKDGKISSVYEGNFLLETAERLVKDEAQLENYRARVSKVLSLVRGSDAIDFPMTDINGKTIHLSDFKGKVVYVDFWATWCIPCCMQIPFMKVVAAKYASDPDVACISISFDHNLDSWKSLLAFDKPEWPQYVSEDAGKQIMTDYGFQAIPRFMIFDKDGKIFSVNAPRPQDMDEVTKIIDSLK